MLSTHLPDHDIELILVTAESRVAPHHVDVLRCDYVSFWRLVVLNDRRD
jgi:hypothetical protein